MAAAPGRLRLVGVPSEDDHRPVIIREGADPAGQGRVEGAGVPQAEVMALLGQAEDVVDGGGGDGRGRNVLLVEGLIRPEGCEEHRQVVVPPPARRDRR